MHTARLVHQFTCSAPMARHFHNVENWVNLCMLGMTLLDAEEMELKSQNVEGHRTSNAQHDVYRGGIPCSLNSTAHVTI